MGNKLESTPQSKHKIIPMGALTRFLFKVKIRLSYPHLEKFYGTHNKPIEMFLCNPFQY